MPVTARSVPNIALIKYWGNRNDELRLPANDSLAMNLSTPSVDVTLDHADVLEMESILANGSRKDLSNEDIARFEKHLMLMKNYLSTLGTNEAIPASLSIKIESGIPPSIGLASSSAVFSAFAMAFSGLIEADLSKEQISVLARLGSGSACRGAYDGFTAISNSDSDSIDGAVCVQIANEDHWMLHNIILVPSMEAKKVGTSKGHTTAATSPHFQERVEAIQSKRQQECIDAIKKKDFEKLQAVSEEDCMDMHNVMQTQDPPLQYLSDDTYRIIDEVKELREAEHLPVLFTMDAGPTVHLFCTDEARDRIAAFAHSQEGCNVFETHVGKGAVIL